MFVRRSEILFLASQLVAALVGVLAVYLLAAFTAMPLIGVFALASQQPSRHS